MKKTHVRHSTRGYHDTHPSCEVTGFPTDSTAYYATAHAATPFGGGHAAAKIVKYITST